MMRAMRLLTIVAMLLAPLAMLGPAHAAVPHGPVVAMGHCPGMPERPIQAPHCIDCAMVCASMPAVAAAIDRPAAAPATKPARLAERALRPFAPEAAIPPPRFS